MSQRPLTAGGPRLQSNQFNSQNNENNNRPLTSITNQKPTNNTLKPPTSGVKNSYYLPRGSKSHNRAGSLQELQNKFDSKQYSQHIGDEGERLDSDQIQLQNLVSDINKKRPKQQRVDKEKLYEEAVNLNNYLAKLQEEQQSLDQKLIQVEDDKYKYQKQIQEVEAYIIKTKGPKIKGQQSQLVINLKKQLEALNEEIRSVDNHISSLKKNTLFTKQSEFEIQIYNFKEQSEKYRLQLVEVRKDNKRLEIEIEKEKKKKNPSYKPKISQKKQKITEADILQQEVYEQRAQSKILQQQNDILKSKQEIEERKIQQNLLQLTSVKDQIQRKDNIYEQMLNNKEELLEQERKKKELLEKEQKKQKRLNNNKSNENSFIMPKKQELTQSDIKKQIIEEKKKIIFDQQRKIEEIDAYLTEKVQKETEQRNKMTNKVQYLRNVIKNLEDKLDKIDTALEDELQHLPIEHLPKFGKGQYTEVFVINNDILHSQQQTKLKKVPKVTLHDIEIIIKELNYKLRIKHIPIEKALQKIIPDKISLRGHGSIQDMQTILQKSPFSILDSDDALLIARYLVEDNQYDFIDLDPFRIQDQEVIRSVFKNLLGSYEILSEEEEYKLWEDITHLITKYGVGLQQQAMLYDGFEETGMLTPQDIEHCFANVIEIPHKKQDYIFLRLFEYGNQYKLMDFRKIMEIFKMGQWFDRNQRRKLSKVLQQEDMKKKQLIDRGFDNFDDEEDDTANKYYYQPTNKKASKTSFDNQSSHQQNSSQQSEKLETRQDKFFHQQSPKKSLKY